MSQPTEMTPEQQQQQAEQEARNAEARAILSRDPALAAATTALEECIVAFDELQRNILPAQAKGLVIPNLDQMVYQRQSSLAEKIDELNNALALATDEEAMGVAMGVHSVGVQYFQGLFFGIHYARIQLRAQGDRPFQRLFSQAYKMLQRTQQEQTGVIVPG